MGRLLPALGLILALLLGTTARASEPPWGPKDLEAIRRAEASAKRSGGFWVVRSASWDVRCWDDRKQAARAAVYIERIHRAWTSAFQVRYRTKRRPLLTIYAKQAYQERFDDGTRGRCRYKWDAEGRFTELGAETYLEPGANPLDFTVLSHECSHALLVMALGPCNPPAWLDESLAVYFQSWNPFKDKAENLERDVRLFAADLPQILPGIETFSRLQTAETFNADRLGPVARANYAVAEAFAHSLMGSKRGRRVLVALLNELRNSGKLSTQGKAFAAARAIWEERRRRR